MVLSQRSQYGVRAVFELAKRADTGPVKAAAIASAQQIPLRFLENILAQLRQGGIVESARGKEGGYFLARHPEDLSVGEVLRLLEGDISSVDCKEVGGGRDCSLLSGCVLLPMWQEAHQAMMSVFDFATFEHLLEQERMSSGCSIPDYVI
jgi:Rrf2 family cysteine metabolism transcriptional repressor